MEIEENKPHLENVKKRIKEINSKYSTDRSRNSLSNIIDGFASQSVQRNVEESRTEKEALFKNREDLQKELKSDQRKLLPKKDRDDLGEQFMGLLIEFLNKLNAKEIDLSKIKHPTDYNKLFRSGGAAEGTRAVLAYQIAVYRQICLTANEIPAAIVIDTPNQQEQANLNYKAIIKLIMEELPSDTQVILCAMENNDLSPYSKKANVIELNKSKLLTSEVFDELDEELSNIIKRAI